MFTFRTITRPHFLFLLLPLGLLMQGCAEKAASRSPTRQYAVDQGNLAATCKVDKVTPVAGKETAVAMTVSNGGGRCSIAVSRDNGRPYGAGLLTKRPAHGVVYIHTVGDDTRIDYTPRSPYAGPDAFTVTLVPGDAVLAVNVTVTK